MTILVYKNYNDLSVFTTVVYICVQHIALWIFIRKCECLDFKNGNTEGKTCECAHRNIYTVSKKTKNSFDIRKKIELIIASEKYPLYIHKDQQHTQIRYYLSIYSYKNIQKKDKIIVY